MKTLIVTGSPGTGKTAISKKLAKRLNFYYMDVNKIISRYGLSEGYDGKRRTKIVDVKKLNRILIKSIDFFKKYNFIEIAPMSSARSAKALAKENMKKYNGIVIDSHLSHYLPRKYVDLCIVTKCDIKELNKRLKKRKYPKSKIQENIQAEIFDICLNEAKEGKHNLVIVNTTKGFNIAKLSKQIGETDAV